MKGKAGTHTHTHTHTHSHSHVSVHPHTYIYRDKCLLLSPIDRKKDNNKEVTVKITVTILKSQCANFANSNNVDELMSQGYITNVTAFTFTERLKSSLHSFDLLSVGALINTVCSAKFLRHNFLCPSMELYVMWRN